MTETTTTKTPFPERMHNQAVETHDRRARNALEAITKEAAMFLWRLENGQEVDPISVRQLAVEAIQACEHLSVLETLREVREWDDAERNDHLSARLPGLDHMRGDGRNMELLTAEEHAERHA